MRKTIIVGAACCLSGCVTYYDLELRSADLAERRIEAGTNDEVCTARGRRFNMMYAHEAKTPPPADFNRRASRSSRCGSSGSTSVCATRASR